MISLNIILRYASIGDLFNRTLKKTLVIANYKIPTAYIFSNQRMLIFHQQIEHHKQMF